MELSEIYQDRNGIIGDFTPKISFEIFPPKNGDISGLFEELRILKRYNPVLVSMTYGASGGLSRFSFENIKNTSYHIYYKQFLCFQHLQLLHHKYH